jgi:VWFA-related protein
MRMFRRQRGVVFAAGCGLVWLAGSAAAQSVERSLYVSVLDASGAPVTDLAARDFVVREDNGEREVLRVSPATEPIQIALLVDNSQAAEPFIGDFRRALHDFVTAVDSQHQIALIGLGQRPTILVDYTRDRRRLDEGVSRLFAQTGSGTYLMDAITEVAQGLQRRESTRRVLVAIVTKGPEFSSRYSRQVLDELRQSGAVLDAFVMTSGAGPRADASGTQPAFALVDDLSDQNVRERELTLSQGPALTGGRREDLGSSMSVSSRLRDLARELNNQYRVVYAATRDLIPAESVEVSVRRPELRVRATRIPPK